MPVLKVCLMQIRLWLGYIGFGPDLESKEGRAHDPTFFHLTDLASTSVVKVFKTITYTA
ncbi:hypothetical protein ABLO27_10170 [Roseibium sp. SCPC15]|uniref:hypothetical protein n=1 Tax=Roseibium sp. SCP15 TaxID=3141376 RepID=UPI00333D37ED